MRPAVPETTYFSGARRAFYNIILACAKADPIATLTSDLRIAFRAATQKPLGRQGAVGLSVMSIVPRPPMRRPFSARPPRW
jgi:hypothetical protein